MYELPIERGKIREFALATQSDDPEYWSANPPVPPTFLTTAAFWWEPPAEAGFNALAFEPTRLLHAAEEYIFHGPPPRAGAALSVLTRISDEFEKRGRRGGNMRFGTVVHEFRDAAGALVVEQRTTLVETSAPPAAS